MIRFSEKQPAELAQPTIVDRMAERMRELGMGGTAVTADSLFEHSDFTRDEIRQHGPEAADLARSKAVRQLEAA